MQTPAQKNALLFFAPIVGVILGVSLLLSPGISHWFGNTFPSGDTGEYAYYDRVISEEELTKLNGEQQVFTVHYSQPIDGISGSVWNSQEEADNAEADYRARYGEAHGIMGHESNDEPGPAPDEITTITQ